MSYVAQDQETGQYRVRIPDCKKLPPNPHIGGLAALQRAKNPPSEISQIDTEDSPEDPVDKKLRYALLGMDQRSFFTGSASADLQAAHVLNAVRRNPYRQQSVTDYLTLLKFHPPIMVRFSLDEIYNVILLEANLHVHWHLYGTFCFVPTQADGAAMLEVLQDSNARWAELQKEFESPVVRPLDIYAPPFLNPHWEVVVLYPHALLPDEQPLPILENRGLLQLSGEMSDISKRRWRNFIASGDQLQREDKPMEFLPPFQAMNLRGNSTALSSFTMIVNAHSKLSQYMRQQAEPEAVSTRIREFDTLMSKLVAEIFFLPGIAFQDVIPTPRRSLHLARPGDSPSPRMELPRPSSFPLGTNSGSATLGQAVGSGETNIMDFPEEPNDNGLTDTEFDLLNAKANDPRLGCKERADAAMLMLFGPQPYLKPQLLP